ncbi:alcohol dehydrogenase catalytic domain-containing protein [Streptomyces sp. NPDC047079]|uniref:alcohol dehydrogenase catalytic domain-containing protein n=1 Tax=Streptomyces sp. NPDC047079 TaxID=3154607 RepID=UPI00340348FB
MPWLVRPRHRRRRGRLARGPGQVRIRVEAATVNPVDLVTRSSALVEAGLMAARERTGIGWDVAGMVDRLRAGVTAFAPGQRVIGLRDLSMCLWVPRLNARPRHTIGSPRAGFAADSC